MINVTEAATLCNAWVEKGWILYCAKRGYDFAPCSNGRTTFDRADIIHWIVYEN